MRMQLVFVPIDRVVHNLIPNGDIGSFVTNNMLIVISLPKGNPRPVLHQVDIINLIPNWCSIAMLVRMAFKLVRSIVEDNNTVDMVWHDNEGVQTHMVIMVWQILPAVGRDLTQWGWMNFVVNDIPKDAFPALDANGDEVCPGQ